MPRMASTSPASRLVASAARGTLRPLGLQRRGRSRLWLDDHGWWLGVVEFGSSSWTLSSCLDVGVMWLWHDLDHFAFHVHRREARHEPYRSDTQFAPEAARLAGLAANRVLDYRAALPTVAAAARYLADLPAGRGDFREGFDAGLAAALAGDPGRARAHLDRFLARPADLPWMADARQEARQLRARAEETGEIREWAAEKVHSCRRRLKLPALPAEPDFATAPLTMRQ